MDQLLFYAMPVVFILGILCIAFEDMIKINKSATVLAMCVILWGLLLARVGISDGSPGFYEYLRHNPELADETLFKQLTGYVSDSLVKELGGVSQTLFFVLCSMLIITLVDKFGGFRSVIKLFQTNNKRLLFVTTSLLAFCFSALLDNLAAAILVLAILNKLVPDRTDRMKFACMAIIACNAGGSWSPVGDVTTLLLWTNERLTLWGQVSTVFLPALANLAIPLALAYFFYFDKGVLLRVAPPAAEARTQEQLPERISRLILVMGFLAIALVPVWQLTLGIPPFLGVIIGLTVLWVFTDLYLAARKRKTGDKSDLTHLSVVNLLHDADLPTFFYFTGVLMSVAALVTGGQLALMQGGLDHATAITSDTESNNLFLSLIIGLMSSFTDNVALVAAIIGVYPLGYGGLGSMLCDGSFWTFLAYCSVTGGSLLIIGSATGVTVMGIERVPFGYYLKRFTPLALAGYFGGAGVYYLLNVVF